MTEEENSTDLAEERTEKADERTDLAEDRTLLANERTFAGWARTAFASIGLGLGFQALLKEIEPTWAAKSVASIFVGLGVWIIWKAERRASRFRKEQSAHQVKPAGGDGFRILATAATVGSIGLLICLWVIF